MEKYRLWSLTGIQVLKPLKALGGEEHVDEMTG
jgi:hypothetical protein